MFQREDSGRGMKESPGGFVFGVEGWSPGEPKPTSITFFLDGSAMVADQHGYPIKGAIIDGKEFWFATTPPAGDQDKEYLMPYEPRSIKVRGRDVQLATHVEVIKALALERVNWTSLAWAGTPQLPYEELKKVERLHTASIDELRRIPDATLRKDALRVRREWEAARRKEIEAIEAE